MILASLEVWHSRAIAPTRRVALGDSNLPTEPAPGPGGLLLGAVLAQVAPELDKDLRAEMMVLMRQIERGQPIGQPRLRHRLQNDRIGLTRSRHRLYDDGDGLKFDIDTSKRAPAPSALAAIYACGDVPEDRRADVMTVLRRGIEWVGPIGPGLVDHLVGSNSAVRTGILSFASDPIVWALETLGLAANGFSAQGKPHPSDVQRRYRALIRDAHPDHGGGTEHAAHRIAELGRARQILLA